jgi:hypothetical protein
MAMTRKDFLRLTFFVSGAAAVGMLLPGCSDDATGTSSGGGGGGGDGGGGGKGDGGGGGGGRDAASEASADASTGFKCTQSITQNHGHTVTIAKADLDGTEAKTLSIIGTADHDHQITLEPQDLADLKAGISVKKTSTDGGTSHDHEVSIVCVN